LFLFLLLKDIAPNSVLRGGSWNNNDNNSRVANRNNNNPDNTNNNIGFRVARSLLIQSFGKVGNTKIPRA